MYIQVSAYFCVSLYRFITIEVDQRKAEMIQRESYLKLHDI